ncbi:hypothetical protein ISN45_Aa01g002620 [Arabidopsis thaliana x Arabidopsis arenosa]|uniref:Uncharacterized protein n=1 Tax=Arabidopsis thaliana x Arabidopsis arenosa TaxID=1240361 RepID=A0A8T2BU68_9BRAS|nr:hypothetical protein ISN45_Aa01g002620 [Arabidopsis thaliana x Arabidopsis arenosa]
MKSQTVLISIFIFSFFALHQCMQMDVGEIEGSNKISIGKCVPAQCSTMKSSHTSLICILMLSLVALHQCVRMKVKEIGRSNKIYIPPCFRDSCDHVLKKTVIAAGQSQIFAGKTNTIATPIVLL